LHETIVIVSSKAYLINSKYFKLQYLVLL
jgi:hypothetical protein